MLSDARGLELTAANTTGVAELDATVASFCALRSDTGDHLKLALAADPDLVMAHILKGCFMMMFGTRAFVVRAEDALGKARAAIGRVGATAREIRHLDALADWVRGEHRAAVARWHDLLVDHPRDLVALKLAQHGDFYLGDSPALRDSLAAALPAWDETTPQYGFVLGCHAFGLEECGDYDAAERAGRRAVAVNPADVWAAHAVAHVCEMQGRLQEGVAWINACEPHWTAVNNFIYHARWHRCLFLLELERYDEVLALYDHEVRPESTDDYLDITNAVAMLWRLEQLGVAVGPRWAELAERSAAHLEDHVLAFADIHYVMALAAAGDRAGSAAWLRSTGGWARDRSDTVAQILAEIGLPLGEATIAHRAGKWGRVVDLMLPLREDIRRIGGSHAQRDLFARMLIDAAVKDGRADLAQALLSERLAARPADAWGLKHRALAASGHGHGAAVEAARLAI